MNRSCKRHSEPQEPHDARSCFSVLLRRLPTRLLEYVVIVLLANHTALQDVINLIRVIRGN
jgi:hypothetical protein